jgi:predicted Fe-S protein YdhL (DUF1289 family)
MRSMSPVVVSPCVGVCVLNPALDACLGCFRQRTEIALWLQYSPAERDTIINSLEARRTAFEASLASTEPAPEE